MGNIFRKKKIATEELETLSQQMKQFKIDIERTHESKRMMLWYMTLATFFLSSSVVAYAWLNIEQNNIKIGLSVLSFFGGILVLWLLRKLANTYYDWKLNRKKKAFDDLLDRKKAILENVRETETFKVAKEILEKYDTETVNMPPPARSSSQPATPSTPKRDFPSTPGAPSGPIVGPNTQRRGPPPPGAPGMPPPGTVNRPPMMTPMVRPGGPRGPVRPYHKESSGALEKMVDYFFGDGPNNRMALICNNCHGHNGMALSHEYDYIAYVCFLCGTFNPAKKLREAPVRQAPLPMSLPAQASTQLDSNQSKETAESTSSIKLLSTNTDSEEKSGSEDGFDIVANDASEDDERTPKKLE